MKNLNHIPVIRVSSILPLLMLILTTFILSICSDNPTITKDTDRGEKVVGSEGGEVISADGNVTLDIPSGALESETTIRVEETSEAPSSFPWGTYLGPYYSMEPHDTDFKQPVQVEWNYDSILEQSSDLSPEMLKVIRWSEDGESAEIISNVTADRENGKLTFETDEFSVLIPFLNTDSPEGWSVFNARWGISTIRWYVDSPGPDSWLTSQRIREALTKWESKTSSFEFERTSNRSNAQLVFEETGSIEDLEVLTCGLGIRTLFGFTCFDLSALFVEEELDQNDDVVIRIASDDIPSSSSDVALSVITHEVGHALGIAHPWNWINSDPPIMNNGGRDFPVELHPLDIGALHHHYEADQSFGTVTDIDGNEYKTVVIGEQEWMAENLKVTTYRDGSNIPTELTSEEWVNTANGSFAVYPHDQVDGISSREEMVNAYGNLYNWYAIDDSRGLCPQGWGVPTVAEWDQLVEYIGGYSEENAGELKSRRQVDSPLGGEFATDVHPRWDADDEYYGTDDYGFSGLPGGQINVRKEFGYLGETGAWWALKEVRQGWYSSKKLYNDNEYVIQSGSSNPNKAYSVRCIRK